MSSNHHFFRGELLNFGGGVKSFKEFIIDSLKIPLGVSTFLSKKYIYKNKTTKQLEVVMGWTSRPNGMNSLKEYQTRAIPAYRLV